MTFKQYDKIRRLGHPENQDIFLNDEDEIVIKEKIDGANFRFYITQEGEVMFGSRTQHLQEGKGHKYAKQFKRCIAYVKERLEDKDLGFFAGLIFYGENCVKHTLHYDWDKIPPFLGFDVYNTKTNEYMPWGAAELAFEAIGLPTVKTLHRITAKEARQLDINDEWVPITKYPPQAKPNMKAEGVVFVNDNNGMRAKYVRDDFKESNAAVFGGTPKYNGNDMAAKISHWYCTNARIEKHIFRLTDEGHKLEMRLMEHLPTNVWRDIWEEEWETIIFDKASNDVIDVRKTRKIVTKRCLAVLKQIITNNALEEKQ